MRRRHGHDALCEGHLPQPLLRRAEPHSARPGRRSPPDLRPVRRGRHRDEHLRREPHQVEPLRPGRPGPRDQRAGRAHRAQRGEGAGLGRRRDRSSRHPDRAVGQDRRGRSGRVFRRTGARAPRGRRRPLRARDFPRRERDWRGDPRRALGLRSADRRADDDRGRREHARRRGAGSLRSRARALGCRCRRAELQRRARRDARNHRASGAGRDGQALGAAERRTAARNRRPQHLSVLARVHGVVRPALHRQWGPARRRLLRNDPGAHPPDQAGGSRAVAECGRAGDDATRRRLRPRRRRWTAGAGNHRQVGEVPHEQRARARDLRRERRARAAARLSRRVARRAGATPPDPRRRSREHPGRPARDGPHERARGVP